MFENFQQNIENLHSLKQIDGGEIAKLEARFPGVPEDYLSFLDSIGYGNLGDIQLYSGPVPPETIYGATSTTDLNGLVIFGDDFQGHCFAFDTNNSYRVVEISPKGEVDDSIEDSFTKLLEGYFA